MKAFRGMFTALGTPMTSSGEIDEPGLRRLTRHVLDAGMHGVLVNGSMGGFPWLTEEQQVKAASIVVDETAGAAPVISGVGEGGTRRAQQKIARLTAVKVDAVAVLPPSYIWPTQPEMRSFFSAIAEEAEIPVLIYDNPGRTHCHVTPETIAALRREHSNIVGVKESNQDCFNLQNLIDAVGDDEDFCVLTGSEGLLLVSLRMGCHGSIGGLHNVCPRIVVECYEAFSAGDLARAKAAQDAMIRIAAIFQYGAIWGGFNEALRYLGICEQASAAPFTSALTSEEAERVREILRQNLEAEPVGAVTSEAR